MGQGKFMASISIHSSFAFLRLPSIPLHRPSFCLKILENILRAKQTERKENQEIAYFLFTYFLYFILKKIQFSQNMSFIACHSLPL
jgi:hypothetical protein